MTKAALFSFIVVLFCSISFLGGCCCMPKCFEKDSRPGLTACESDQRLCRSVQLDLEMAWEDWDHLWLLEKPSRLDWLRVR